MDDQEARQLYREMHWFEYQHRQSIDASLSTPIAIAAAVAAGVIVQLDRILANRTTDGAPVALFFDLVALVALVLASAYLWRALPKEKVSGLPNPAEIETDRHLLQEYFRGVEDGETKADLRMHGVFMWWCEQCISDNRALNRKKSFRRNRALALLLASIGSLLVSVLVQRVL